MTGLPEGHHVIAERERLEVLRAALRAESISYGELAELESLAEFIEPGDVELLEAAGVPEKLVSGRFTLSLTVAVSGEGLADGGKLFAGELAGYLATVLLQDFGPDTDGPTVDRVLSVSSGVAE